MFKALNITIIITSICLALLTYYNGYNAMFDAHPSSRGFAEFFVLISSIIVLINGISLFSIISKLKRWAKITILALFTLLTIIPMSMQNIRLILPTLILSTVVVLIGAFSHRKIELKHIDILNVFILITTVIWSLLMVRTM